MKSIKALIATASALALCVTPVVSDFAPTNTVSYAASSTAGSTSTMNIADSAISVSLSKRTYGGGGAVTVSGPGWTSNDGGRTVSSTSQYKARVGTDWVTNTNKIRRHNFYFTIQVPKSCTKNPKQLINIYATYKDGNHAEGGMYLKHSQFIVTEVNSSNSSVRTYNVQVPFSTFGDKYKIGVDLAYDGVYTLQNQLVTLSGFALSDGDIGYTRCDATCSNGESIHLLMKTDGFTTEETKNYMKMLCRYVNSLSDITGIKRKDVYVMFDELNGCPGEYPNECPCMTIGTISSDDSVPLVLMPRSYSTTAFKNTVKNCQLDWGMMHELSHCYSFATDNKHFASAYNYTGDDVSTNVRGVTALQNCSQLRSTNVVKGSTNVGNYTTALINATYSFEGERPFYEVINVFGKYAKKYGWVSLEKLYGGDFDSPNIINGVVYGAIESLKYDKNSKYYNKDIKFTSADTYRFINNLYYLSKNASGYGKSKEQFKSFIKNFVGVNVFGDFINFKSNDSSLYEAGISDIKGDLNLDGRLTSADITEANKYFADNYNLNNNGLTPEGAFNFDMNSDGYINQEDLNKLKKSIK